MPRTFVIVGASLAGGTAAATLRDEGFDGRVVLVGAEAELPYERPPLSKRYLRGELPRDKLLVRPEGFWEENRVELVLGKAAVAIDPVAREVELAGGGRLGYDRLLVATGGRNRRLPVPGVELEGVLDLRTVGDCERIQEAARDAGRAVVVGMGFIGSEVASTLRELGLEVVAVEPFQVPLERALGAEVGQVIADLHAEHGVEAHYGEGVEAFAGDGRVRQVVTSGGRRIDCDLAVVGVGIEPAVDVVEGSGVAVDDGILVDELCRTSVEDVYAAGDVANHLHPLFGRRIRVEHWRNAIEQGAHAARAMLGKTEPYAEVHWFWSDQYDANIQYAGHHTTWEELVVRGSPEERKLVAFYLDGGLVDAAVAVNSGRDLRRAQALIRARVRVEPAKLRDPDVDLRELVPAT
jgi:3-phenylpropionate/trans-cinnamate dioxygenase ferredoxin reductase subunit